MLKTNGIRLGAPSTAPQKVSSGDTVGYGHTSTVTCTLLGPIQQNNSHTGQLGLENQEVTHTICWAEAAVWELPQTITVESWKRHAMSSQHVVPSVG